MNTQGETLAVGFLPSGATVQVEPGCSLIHAAGLSGMTVDTPCGGQGNCGKCKVIIHGAQPSLTRNEQALLSHSELQKGYRLACQVQVHTPLVVKVPEHSLLRGTHQILGDTQATRLDVSETPVRTQEVCLAAPSLEDDLPDLARLERVLGPLETDLEVLRALPRRFRDASFQGTAVLAGRRLLAFFAAKHATAVYAAAFDLGTTTLAASLLNLESGEEEARVARLNPQTRCGEDVLARITCAGQPEGLERLRREMVQALNETLEELAHAAAVQRDQIFEVVLAGNPTMQQLALGLDPASIGVSPFVATVGGAVSCAAREVGLCVHPQARCYLFPLIASYVGGDIVAGLVATGFEDLEAPSLFIDIGTNGEMVLNAGGGRLIATSCAAGPAFEGANIRHGVRAANGAIEAVRLDKGLFYKTIGNAPATGLCGSAIIDVVAELLRCGLIASAGEFCARSGAPQAVLQRLGSFEGESGFLLANKRETASGQEIVLFQSDVRQVQLATAAVRSAVSLLLERAGVEQRDLRRVLVAGGFGNYIRCGNAQRMGLLPMNVPEQRIAFVGNTALRGARLAAASEEARRRAASLAGRTEHLDLSLDPAFQDRYVDALFFPGGD